jgi:hypothetical protein
MDAQYAIRGVVRYYGWLPKEAALSKGVISGILDLSKNVDTTRWSTPPHLALANLPTYRKGSSDMRPVSDGGLDPKAAEAFIRRYGPVYTDDDVWLDDKRFPAGYFKETVDAIHGAQYLLRKAWSGNSEVIGEHFSDGTLSESFKVVSFEILQNYAARRSSEVLLETEVLWEYIRYLFLTDYSEKRLSVCEREDCPTPYFVQQRKGQRYCSHDCAVVENVRRFRTKARKK